MLVSSEQSSIFVTEQSPNYIYSGTTYFTQVTRELHQFPSMSCMERLEIDDTGKLPPSNKLCITWAARNITLMWVQLQITPPSNNTCIAHYPACISRARNSFVFSCVSTWIIASHLIYCTDINSKRQPVPKVMRHAVHYQISEIREISLVVLSYVPCLTICYLTINWAIW